ncbi:MAG TPA: histidine kinase dimerization/phospho-acceptor domain-containing protein, partial [Cystobacter sp.]
MNPPSPPFETSMSPEAWRRHKRTLGVFAAIVPLLHPLDWLALGQWSLAPQVVRLVWSTQMLLYILLYQVLGPRWERRLADYNSIAICCCFLALVHTTGGPHSFYLYLLPSVPLIIALIEPRDGRPALVGGFTCALGAMLMLLAQGQPRAAFGWALLLGAATFFGVYGATQHHKAQEAEHAVRLERARRESLEKLALAERQRAQTEKLAMVGRLAAGVVHEINNPLAFVCSNLEFLRTEVLRQSRPEEAHAELSEVFDETRQGVERIRQIVSDLRSYSHVDMEEPSPCALADVVTDAARLAGVRLKNVARLTVALPPELPGVFAIRRRLAQVVLNLLVNAGDALEEARVRGGEVRVTGVAEGARVA